MFKVDLNIVSELWQY